MTSGQVLVVGLDGADLRYLDRFSDVLPTIGTLRDDGVDAPLASTHPPWTGSAWPSLYTGVDPSYHGVYDFFDYRGAYPDEADVVTRNDVRAPAIWNYLTSAGLRSVVVNVPITHPAEELDGVIVPGYLAPADEPGYPEGIRDRLADALGHPYHVYSEHETAPQSERKIDGYETLIEERAAAAAHLLETEEWDFAMVQVQKTDAVFHNSSSPDEFKRIYRAADDLVDRLLDACDGTPNVVVCSDHGMGPVDGYDVYVNELLATHGLVESTRKTTDRSLVGVKEAGETPGEDRHSARTTELLTRVARRAGVGPSTAYRVLQRVGVGDRLSRFLPDDVKRSLVRGVDWRASRAYCRRGSEQGIRINLEGREPAGIVSPEDYESVRDEVVRVLSEFRTGDGDPVFEFVSRREEVYDGPYTEEAPDVLFRTAGMNHKVLTEITGETLVSVDSYSHKRTGAFVAAGPDVDEGWDGGELSLVDVAPVVFSLLGLAVPDRTTGSVPPGLTTTTPERRSYGEVSYAGRDSYSQDQQAVNERLRDLGYL